MKKKCDLHKLLSIKLQIQLFKKKNPLKITHYGQGLYQICALKTSLPSLWLVYSLSSHGIAFQKQNFFISIKLNLSLNNFMGCALLIL